MSQYNHRKLLYQFSAPLWKYEGAGGWHFVSMPKEMALEIKSNFSQNAEAWGRIKVLAEVGEHSWETSIWYDKKRQTYLLPIKSEVRKTQKIELSQTLTIQVSF